MKIPPKYTIIPEMLRLISEIEAEKIYFSNLELPKNLKDRIQRVSLLKSSLFSARIEGNPLRYIDLSKNPSDLKKLEVFNIVKASQSIEKLKKGLLEKNLVLALHGMVLKKIHAESGLLRSEPSAIYNQAGVAIYISPSPSKINSLLDELFDYINSDIEKFPIITAFVAHLVFEKIHPFLDGNGRVGRLLIAAVLKVKDWNFSFTIPFEEYIDTNKDLYYFHLDQGLQETNEYLIFMLNGYLEQIKVIRSQINQELASDKEFLPPRQEEIYSLIKDHSVMSFDMIKRRFLNIPERTLRYDLKKLFDKGLIEKTGETKGRYYRAKNSNA